MDADQNFMDFSENIILSRKLPFSRPLLTTEKHMVYEDSPRSNSVLDEMHRFLQDERFCDMKLCVENVKFPCHRIVLAASSLYFERMFSNGMTEASAREVTLNEVTPCALQNLIEFAYSSKLSVTQDTVLEIFEAADMLQFQTARVFCEDFLLDQIDKQNCLSFMLYADAFSCEHLYDKAKMCAAENFKTVCCHNEFFHLPINHLLCLLCEDNIDMEYEEHVYETLKQWIIFDQESRSAYIPDLVRCIRLNFVSRWYLIEVISKDNILSCSAEAQKFVQSAKDQLLAQGHTYEIPWQLPPSRKKTGLTQKIVFINTHDPNPGESEVHLFDAINKSWSTTNKPCPLASELSTCETLGDALLIIGGWKSDGKSMNKRGGISMIHEFKVMSIFPTLWYVGAHPVGITRYYHTTVTVGDKLYLFGGYDETQSLQASMFVTDAERGYRFEVCPRMLYPVSRSAAVYVDSKIFSFGGFSHGGVPRQFIQCFDIHLQKWTEVASGIEEFNMSYQYVTNIDNIFYVFCGDVSNVQNTQNVMVNHSGPIKVLDSIYTFNLLQKEWKLVYKFSEPRTGNFCIATLDGKIYITGGLKGSLAYNAVDCYHPLTNTLEVIGNTKEGGGRLSLCTTMKVMHENFGL